jgi:hypothetical protein
VEACWLDECLSCVQQTINRKMYLVASLYTCLLDTHKIFMEHIFIKVFSGNRSNFARFAVFSISYSFKCQFRSFLIRVIR